MVTIVYGNVWTGLSVWKRLMGKVCLNDIHTSTPSLIHMAIVI
jgi:hypothetical protein